MSKRGLRSLTTEERASLGAQVKAVRLQLGLTQAELATEAGVTRQSIGNIEAGLTIPQEKTLLPILEALGMSPHPATFTSETSQWLAIVGGIMDSLPDDRRASAGQAAVNAVTQELVAAAQAARTNVGGSVNYEIPHIGYVDVEALRRSGVALAADKRAGIEEEQEQSQELP